MRPASLPGGSLPAGARLVVPVSGRSWSGAAAVGGAGTRAAVERMPGSGRDVFRAARYRVGRPSMSAVCGLSRDLSHDQELAAVRAHILGVETVGDLGG